MPGPRGLCPLRPLRPPATAAPVAELDELVAAAKTHSAGFDEISEFDRAAKLRAALDSPAGVLGTTAELQVTNRLRRRCSSTVSSTSATTPPIGAWP